jgi:hypothetical protein
MRSILFSIVERRQHKKCGKAKKREIQTNDSLYNISPHQTVPVVLENFWASSVSKTAFQALYVKWLTTNYEESKSLSPNAWLISGGRAFVNDITDGLHLVESLKNLVMLIRKGVDNYNAR